MSLGVEWSPIIVDIWGANIGIFGEIGQGKTTLMKSSFDVLRKEGKQIGNGFDYTDKHHEKHHLPFPMVVYAIPKVLDKDWRTPRDFPVRKHRVLMTAKRHKYFLGSYSNAFVLLEDLPTQFKEKPKLSVWVVNNLLSGIRKTDSVFAVTAQSFADFKKYMDKVILTKFTHYVIFQSKDNLLTMRWSLNIPLRVCHHLNYAQRQLKENQYLVFDTKRRIITKPVHMTNPIPFLRVLVRQEKPEEIFSLSELWEYTKPKKRKKKGGVPPLSPIDKKIVETLKAKPTHDLRLLARQLGMPKGTLYQHVNRMKKRGYLEKDVRYGAPRR